MMASLFCGIIGCSRKVYVPVEVERERVAVDSLVEVRNAVDSVEVRDSIVIVVKGDTLLRDRIRTVDRVRVRVDTVVRERRDTLIVERAVTVGNASEGRGKPRVGGGVSVLTGVLLAVAVSAVIRRLMSKS